MKIIEKEAGVYFTLDLPKTSEHSMKEPNIIFCLLSFTLLSYSHFLNPWLLLHHCWCTNLQPAPLKLYCPSSGKMVTPKFFPYLLKLLSQLHELINWTNIYLLNIYWEYANVEIAEVPLWSCPMSQFIPVYLMEFSLDQCFNRPRYLEITLKPSAIST